MRTSGARKATADFERERMRSVLRDLLEALDGISDGIGRCAVCGEPERCRLTCPCESARDMLQGEDHG